MDNPNRLAQQLLEAELDVIAERLQTEAMVPSASSRAATSSTSLRASSTRSWRGSARHA